MPGTYVVAAVDFFTALFDFMEITDDCSAPMVSVWQRQRSILLLQQCLREGECDMCTYEWGMGGVLVSGHFFHHSELPILLGFCCWLILPRNPFPLITFSNVTFYYYFPPTSWTAFQCLCRFHVTFPGLPAFPSWPLLMSILLHVLPGQFSTLTNVPVTLSLYLPALNCSCALGEYARYTPLKCSNQPSHCSVSSSPLSSKNLCPPNPQNQRKMLLYVYLWNLFSHYFQEFIIPTRGFLTVSFSVCTGQFPTAIELYEEILKFLSRARSNLEVIYF